MKITALTVGPVETNCYLVSDGDGVTAILDPGAEPEKIIACMEEDGLTPRGHSPDPRAFRPYLWIVSANRGLPRSVGISSYPGYSLFIFSEAKRLRRFNWRAFRLGREGGGNI